MLDCLERAAIATDADERRRLLTFCIVGGGPTGVEYAGALAELVRLVLPHEYPEFPPSDVRIVMLEGGDRVLPTFKKRLSKYARRELEHRGVDVRTDTLVASADERGVVLQRRHRAADRDDRVDRGRAARRSVPHHPGVTRTEQQRFAVDDHLRMLGAEHVYAIGDVAAAPDRHGQPLPMLSPPAMQAGRYVARQIRARPDARKFRYLDKGTMATIGRRAAVAQIGPIQLTGLPRLGRLARRAPLLPDRLREPAARDAALGLVLRAPRPARTLDPAGRPARRGRSAAGMTTAPHPVVTAVRDLRRRTAWRLSRSRPTRSTQR